jgi:hypothetical protein
MFLQNTEQHKKNTTNISNIPPASKHRQSQQKQQSACAQTSMLHILQASMPLHTLSKRLSLSSTLTLLHTHRWRPLSCQMSADSSPLTHSITLPIQLAEPVQIVAAPGISESEFRRVTLFFIFYFYP